VPLHLGRDGFSRELFLVSLLTWADWPRGLELPSEHFCLLLVGDASGASDDAIQGLAGRAIDDGCAYLCAWGPDCGRVHAMFDMVLAERDVAGTSPNALHVMTTSHEGETLEDAIEFLNIAAWPDDEFVDSCDTSLIAVVGNTEWVASISRQLGK
jgi:hypothetical protein